MILYVYFKFSPSDLPEIAKLIKDMQHKLSTQFPSLSYRLMKRPEQDDQGRETWMEAYELYDGDESLFKKMLNDLVQQNNLPQPRFNEIFIPI
jgi:hypothetical protein